MEYVIQILNLLLQLKSHKEFFQSIHVSKFYLS
jgi:hypothetical protein